MGGGNNNKKGLNSNPLSDNSNASNYGMGYIPSLSQNMSGPLGNMFGFSNDNKSNSVGYVASGGGINELGNDAIAADPSLASLLVADMGTGSDSSGEGDIVDQFTKMIRQPYQGESNFFSSNPAIAGMATEDNKIILNPASGLNPTEEKSVIANEGIRIAMRKMNITPDIMPTTEQLRSFVGTPYETNLSAMKQTIIARILSGDPSAGATPEQRRIADGIMQQITDSYTSN